MVKCTNQPMLLEVRGSFFGELRMVTRKGQWGRLSKLLVTLLLNLRLVTWLLHTF